MLDKIIYLDNAATTPIARKVLEAMRPYQEDLFYNPSAFYPAAQQVKAAMEQARMVIAESLGARPREIHFTSGGTESDNWALKGVAEAILDTHPDRTVHMIVSAIEHPAVLRTAAWLQDKGVKVDYLAVDTDGVVDLDQLATLMRDETALVSVMAANNEVGTIQPLCECAAIAHAHGALFHTDAVQAYMQIPLSVDKLGIDLLSASAHKFNGPKGVGFLYWRESSSHPSPPPFIHGGSQERGIRAGTENAAGIVGMSAAVELASISMEQHRRHVQMLRDHGLRRVQAAIPQARFNGSLERRLPGNINLSIPGISSETLLMRLASSGICASAGSACAAGSLEPSHVLLAMGVPNELTRCTLRLTPGSQTTFDEFDFAVSELIDIVHDLQRFRSESPLS